MLGTCNWRASTCFSNVKKLALHLGSLREEMVLPVFRLPTLCELDLDVRRRERYSQDRWSTFALENWESKTSGIEILRIVQLRNGSAPWIDMPAMSAACKALRHVSILIQAVHMISNTVSTLWPHIRSGVLTKLQLVGLMPSLDHPTHYEFAFLDVHPAIDMDDLCREKIKMT
jgi:hypothetical protein